MTLIRFLRREVARDGEAHLFYHSPAGNGSRSLCGCCPPPRSAGDWDAFRVARAVSCVMCSEIRDIVNPIILRYES